MAKDSIIVEATAAGIPVIIDRNPDSQSAAYMAAVSTGSRDESPDVWGISHLLEHVVFRATGTYDSYTMAKEMEGAGGMLNAFTGKEMTAFYGITLKETSDVARKFVADIVCDPKISSDDTEMEKKIVLQEISMCENDPSSYIHDLFAETVWRGHELGHNEAGTTDIVRGLTSDDLRAYYEDRYLIPNITVFASGCVDPEEAVTWAEDSFDGMSGGRRNVRTAPPVHEAVYRHFRRKDEHCYVGMGFPTGGPEDPDRFPIMMLSTVLGAGSSSRLFQQVREERALVYSVYSSQDMNSDAASMGAFFSSTGDNVPEAVETVGKVFREAKNGIGGEELARAKNIVKGSLVRAYESTSNRIYRMARQRLVAGESVTLEEQLRRLDSVTCEDVARAAEKVIRQDRLHVVMYGPDVEAMKGFSPDQIEL